MTRAISNDSLADWLPGGARRWFADSGATGAMDPESTAVLLDRIASQRTGGPIRFRLGAPTVPKSVPWEIQDTSWKPGMN